MNMLTHSDILLSHLFLSVFPQQLDARRQNPVKTTATADCTAPARILTAPETAPTTGMLPAKLNMVSTPSQARATG